MNGITKHLMKRKGNNYLWVGLWSFIVVIFLLSNVFRFIPVYLEESILIILQLLSIIILIPFIIKIKNQLNKKNKIFYLLFTCSLISLFTTNILQICLISLQQYNLQIIINKLYWNITYLSTISIQIILWMFYLLKEDVTKINYKFISSNLKSLLTVGFIITGIVISFFLYSFPSDVNLITSIMEMTLLYVLAMFMTRSDHPALNRIVFGLVIFLINNHIYQFTHADYPLYNLLNIASIISNIYILNGLFNIFTNEKKTILLQPKNSINVFITRLLFFAATTVFILCSIIGVIMLSLINKNVRVYEYILLYLPPIIILIFFISHIIGKYISIRLSSPIHQIIKNMSYEEIELKKYDIEDYNILYRSIYVYKEKINELNNERKLMLSKMTHDIRTVLSGIKSISSIFHKECKSSDRKDLYMLVVEQAKNGLAMLDEVYDYYNYESSSDVIDEFLLDQLIKDLTYDFMDVAIQKKVTFETNFRGNNLYSGSSFIIESVIYEVISNAVKFTENGKVVINTLSYRGDKKDSDYDLIIEIRDEGIGISSENLVSIYKPFYRVQKSTVSMFPGIGLGLSRVKKMMDDVRGEITIDSVLGVGTLCTLKFREWVSDITYIA